MESPKVNFTNEETRKLRELVEHNKYVLFNKKSTAVSNRLKDETWNAIAQEFNSCSTTYRSAKQLKYKFDNMKKLARKEMKDYVYDGSGHCPMSNAISNSLQNNLPLSSDAEWLSGLVSGPGPMAGGIPDLQADTTQNNTHFISPDMVPEKRKRELGSPPQMRKKLSSISEMKNRLLHSREVLVKKENMLLSSHIEELHKQEMAHKAERHLAQIEHESKLNEAQLNKLAMEAKLYESQLNKVALESRQLEAQQARDAELHAVRMARESELHEARLAREAELHAALLARETGQHIMRNM